MRTKMEGCVCSWGVDGMGLAVDKSLLGWLCDLRNKTVNPHQVKLALPMYWRVGLCLEVEVTVGVGFQR